VNNDNEEPKAGGKVIDLHTIRAEVEARVEAEKAQLDEEQKKKRTTGGPDDPDFVQQCFANNELGDGILFSVLQRNKFIFDASAGEWLVWAGHYWARDITGQALAAVEDVAMTYVRELQAIGRKIGATTDEDEIERLTKSQSRVIRRIDKLRSVRGRQNCLAFAYTCGESSLVTTGDHLDTKPWLLPCSNGVIDLQTGLLLPGQPDDLMTRAATVEFPEGVDDYLVTGENSPCPHWEAFVAEIMGGNQELADYLGRLFGYGITGLVREHVFAVLFGHGRNGKGTMIETLAAILGPLAAPVPSELLLDQNRVSNPSGPSPAIMALRGLRLAFCSETDQGRRFSASRVKWISGGDTLTGRNPHDRFPSTFQPSHLLCLASNYKPKADASDYAFWQRLHLIEFCMSYVKNPRKENERPIDKTLPERLLEEGPGILAWLVRGCLLWQKVGLNPPPAVLSATADYRRSEDDLAEWIEDRCIEAEDAAVTAKAAYQSFRDWWAANISDKPPSQKRFGDAMAKRGLKKDRGASGGNWRYLGIEVKTLSD